jgi:acyl-CoA dehydrogenase
MDPSDEGRPPPLEDFRDEVRSFVERWVRPGAAEVDAAHAFPAAAVAEAGARGLMGMLVPAAAGGRGLSHLHFTVAIEEIARACASTAVIVDVHNSVASEPVVRFGSPEQRARWLPSLASGACLGAFALTEPSSGSDAASLRSTATPTGSGWVLRGTKTFITNVGRAALYTVFARGPEGISAFLVPGDAPGLHAGQVFRKMGLHGSPTGELVLDGVEVGPSGLLGRSGQGFAVAMTALDSGRIGISGQALGLAQGALDDLLAAAGGAEQGTAFRLAELAASLEAARALTYDAAGRCDRGQPFTRQAAMAKLVATETAVEIASAAVTLAADLGCPSDGAARRFRDARALTIYEGSSQVQKMVIARELLRNAPIGGGRG